MSESLSPFFAGGSTLNPKGISPKRVLQLTPHSFRVVSLAGESLQSRGSWGNQFRCRFREARLFCQMGLMV